MAAPSIPIIAVAPVTTTSLRVTITTNAARMSYYKLYIKTVGGVYAQWPDAATTYLTGQIEITGLTANTSYVVKLAGYNTDGETDSNEATVSTLISQPILTAIEAAMVTLIEAMTTTGGYNYNWGDCNQPDVALKDAFPCADINLPEETNDDPENGDWSGAYENKATFEIRVTGKMSAVADVPRETMKVEHNKALDDLKMLFGVNTTVSDTCNSIMYKGMRRVNENPHGDVFTPNILITTWEVSYAQNRQTPRFNAN